MDWLEINPTTQDFFLKRKMHKKKKKQFKS